ncbi:MAG: Zeta toxin family protein [Planctomycetota bacterium]
MRNSPPRFVLVAGPNGSGKSTIAPYLIRDIWRIERFLNADTVARGLAAFNPDLALVSAGRTLLTEAQRHIAGGTDFALETTLAGKTYARWLAGDLKTWRTHLAFVYTRSADENVLRVGKRVLAGGHHVPEEDVRRRYERSFANFFKVYRPLVDSWEVIDNTDEDGNWNHVAQQEINSSIEVPNRVEWNRLEQTYGQ